MSEVLSQEEMSNLMKALAEGDPYCEGLQDVLYNFTDGTQIRIPKGSAQLTGDDLVNLCEKHGKVNVSSIEHNTARYFNNVKI